LAAGIPDGKCHGITGVRQCPLVRQESGRQELIPSQQRRIARRIGEQANTDDAQYADQDQGDNQLYQGEAGDLLTLDDSSFITCYGQHYEYVTTFSD